MTPMRVQLRRSKGWRMPANTVLVSRPSKWGNPFPILSGSGLTESEWRLAALSNFRAALHGREHMRLQITVNDVRRDLRGKNLACWCPLDQPCHADVLLAVANQRKRS